MEIKTIDKCQICKNWQPHTGAKFGTCVLDLTFLTNKDHSCTKIERKDRYTIAVLLFNEQGQLLAVSRKTDFNDFGLVGGSVEEYDLTLEDAAIRECFEETGLILSEPIEVFRYHNDEKNSMGVTFMGKHTGEISTKEAGIVKWTDFEELFKGSFEKYNRKLMEHLIENKTIDDFRRT